MNPEEFISQLEAFKQELNDEVLSQFKKRDKDRGWLAFCGWYDHFELFLKKHTKDEAKNLKLVFTGFSIAARRKTTPSGDFVIDAGKRSIALIDDLITRVEKGRLELFEDISRNIEENSSIKKEISVKTSSPEPMELQEKPIIETDVSETSTVWIFGLISGVISLFLSLLWLYRDWDYEPLLAVVGSFSVIIALILKKEIKGVPFILGFILGICFTASLYYSLSQSNSLEKQTNSSEVNKDEINEKNKQKNTNSEEIVNKDIISSPPTRKLPDGRVIIDASLEFLDSFFKQNIDVQARKLLEVYINKWITVSGQVEEVANRKDQNAFIVISTKDKDFKPLLLLFTNPKEIDRIQTLKRGDKIKVLGQIMIDEDSPSIYLTNCEVVE